MPDGACKWTSEGDRLGEDNGQLAVCAGAGQPRGAPGSCLLTPCVWMTGRPLAALDPRGRAVP